MVAVISRHLNEKEEKWCLNPNQTAIMISLME